MMERINISSTLCNVSSLEFFDNCFRAKMITFNGRGLDLLFKLFCSLSTQLSDCSPLGRTYIGIKQFVNQIEGSNLPRYRMIVGKDNDSSVNTKQRKIHHIRTSSIKQVREQTSNMILIMFWTTCELWPPIIVVLAGDVPVIQMIDMLCLLSLKKANDIKWTKKARDRVSPQSLLRGLQLALIPEIV